MKYYWRIALENISCLLKGFFLLVGWLIGWGFLFCRMFYIQGNGSHYLLHFLLVLTIYICGCDEFARLLL